MLSNIADLSTLSAHPKSKLAIVFFAITLSCRSKIIYNYQRSSFFTNSYSMPGYECLKAIPKTGQFGMMLISNSKIFISPYRMTSYDSRFRKALIRNKHILSNYQNYISIWKYRVFAERYVLPTKNLTNFPLSTKTTKISATKAICIRNRNTYGIQVSLQGPYTRIRIRVSELLFSSQPLLRRSLAYINKLTIFMKNNFNKFRKLVSGVYRRPLAYLYKFNNNSSFIPLQKKKIFNISIQKKNKQYLNRRKISRFKRIRMRSMHKKKKKFGKKYTRIDFWRGIKAKQKSLKKRFRKRFFKLRRRVKNLINRHKYNKRNKKYFKRLNTLKKINKIRKFKHKRTFSHLTQKYILNNNAGNSKNINNLNISNLWLQNNTIIQHTLLKNQPIICSLKYINKKLPFILFKKLRLKIKKYTKKLKKKTKFISLIKILRKTVKRRVLNAITWQKFKVKKRKYIKIKSKKDKIKCMLSPFISSKYLKKKLKGNLRTTRILAKLNEYTKSSIKISKIMSFINLTKNTLLHDINLMYTWINRKNEILFPRYRRSRILKIVWIEPKVIKNPLLAYYNPTMINTKALLKHSPRRFNISIYLFIRKINHILDEKIVKIKNRENMHINLKFPYILYNISRESKNMFGHMTKHIFNNINWSKKRWYLLFANITTKINKKFMLYYNNNNKHNIKKIFAVSDTDVKI
jgi:hypothetical protein